MKRFFQNSPEVAKDFEDCANALVAWFNSQEIDAKEAVALMGYLVSAMIRGDEERLDFLDTMALAWKFEAWRLDKE